MGSKNANVSTRLYLLHHSVSSPPSTASPIQKVSLGKSYPIANYVTCDNFSNTRKCYLATITKVVEPRFYHEVVKHPKWQEAMAKEIEALELNQTWSVVDLPPGCKPINCKWAKCDSDGSVEWYKARLVIRSDKQIKGFDCNETFDPVAKMASVRCFLSIVATNEWSLH